MDVFPFVTTYAFMLRCHYWQSTPVLEAHPSDCRKVSLPESSPGRCAARPWQTSRPGPTFGPRHAETWASATCGAISQMLWAMHRIRSRTHFGGGLLPLVCRPLPNGVSRRAGLECTKVRTVTRSGRLVAQYSSQVRLDDYDILGSSIDGRPARTWDIPIHLRLVSTDHGQQVAGANSTHWS